MSSQHPRLLQTSESLQQVRVCLGEIPPVAGCKGEVSIWYLNFSPPVAGCGGRERNRLSCFPHPLRAQRLLNAASSARWNSSRVTDHRNHGHRRQLSRAGENCCLWTLEPQEDNAKPRECRQCISCGGPSASTIAEEAHAIAAVARLSASTIAKEVHSNSACLHGEFLRPLFLQAHRRLRTTFSASASRQSNPD